MCEQCGDPACIPGYVDLETRKTYLPDDTFTLTGDELARKISAHTAHFVQAVRKVTESSDPVVTEIVMMKISHYMLTLAVEITEENELSVV